MTTAWCSRLARWALPVIILLYLIVGTLYAVLTPPWQAPDEPAHYNYVKQIALHRSLPVLKPGDYPVAYLEEIKAARFPPEMSVEPIRYEFHQPPLYYLLSVPLFQLFGGALLPLRLLSLGLGALLLVVIYWLVLELAPSRPCLALGAAAFVAFLPMHLAMTAAANNDTLAELLLAMVLLLSIRYLKRAASPRRLGEDYRILVLLGITTGLGLITKSTAYVALPLVLAAIAVRHLWLDEPAPPAIVTFKSFAVYLLPAVALAIPWWLRNVALYGNLDILGLVRHDQVVVGQLRTAEYIAEHGSGSLVRAFFQTSFRSFWGQFGWMGVLLDQRIYQALAILSALAIVGFLLWLIRAFRQKGRFSEWQWAAGAVLGLSVVLMLAAYLWYNKSFLQHQGRYLFPALAAIGLFAALGWREALRRRWALWLVVSILAAAAVLRVAGLLPNWPLLMLAVSGAALLVRRFLPESLDPVVHAAPYLGLILLDLVALLLFIVPQLAR
jgi:4-amino-4-deoxy-L-arabinose transferase-like glycosyltransferase